MAKMAKKKEMGGYKIKKKDVELCTNSLYSSFSLLIGLEQFLLLHRTQGHWHTGSPENNNRSETLQHWFTSVVR